MRQKLTNIYANDIIIQITIGIVLISETYIALRKSSDYLQKGVVILMLNEEFILNLIMPHLNDKKELSEFEFNELFSDLTRQEQYEIINLMIQHDIEYVDEKSEETAILGRATVLSTPLTFLNHKQLMYISNEQLCVMAQNGDRNAMAALLEKNKRFVYQMAYKLSNQYKHNCLSLEDLFQEGNLGLMDAARNFDISKDNKFTTYSWHWIRQKITRAIVDTGFIIRVPVHKFEKMMKLFHCQRLNPDATAEELSKLLDGISVQEIYELRVISENYINTTSLNVLVGEDESSELADFIPSDSEISLEDEVAGIILKENIARVLTTLKTRERNVLELRFGLTDGQEHTLEEVGVAFNVTRERIRQIEAKALKKLRHPARAKILKDFLNN